MARKKTTAITPSTMASMPFDATVNEYKLLLEQRRQLKGEMATLTSKIEKFALKHVGRERGEGYSLYRLENLIEVYVKAKPTSDEKDIAKCAKEEGYHFANIANNAAVLRLLEKKFGKKVANFIITVGERYEGEHYGKRKVDEKETSKLRDTYLELVNDYFTAQRQLEVVEQSIADTKDYIDLCDKMASIGSVSRQA